jgi:hypothetical protein
MLRCSNIVLVISRQAAPAHLWRHAFPMPETWLSGTLALDLAVAFQV